MLFTFTTATKAQELRQFKACDSTEYFLNADTTIVVGKYNLYAKTEFDLQLIYEFDMPVQGYYIRDFDIITPDHWYTLIGDTTISNPTFLYQSKDRGLSWTIDNTYFTAIDSSITNITFDPFDPNYYKSINQVQKLGTDTILLFLGYYGSGIVYSIDGGTSWKHWFANSPAYYFGLIECGESYYLFQLEGDGFVGRMFPFDKQFLFRNDSLVNFDHLPSGSGHHPPFHLIDLPHVLYFSNVPNCEVYSFLNDYVNSTCATSTPIIPLIQNQSLTIYPNPSSGQFTIHLNTPANAPIEMSLFNYTGQKIFQKYFPNATELSNYDYAALASGKYLLILKSQSKLLTRKILVY